MHETTLLTDKAPTTIEDLILRWQTHTYLFVMMNDSHSSEVGLVLYYHTILAQLSKLLGAASKIETS